MQHEHCTILNVRGREQITPIRCQTSYSKKKVLGGDLNVVFKHTHTHTHTHIVIGLALVRFLTKKKVQVDCAHTHTHTHTRAHA